MIRAHFSHDAVHRRCLITCIAVAVVVVGCGESTIDTSGTGATTGGDDSSVSDVATDSGSGAVDSGSAAADTAKNVDDSGAAGDDAAKANTDSGSKTTDGAATDGAANSDSGQTDAKTGCKKTNPATEVCDGVDNDCDGKTDNAAGAKPLCDDGKACTKDACDGKDGCKHPDDDGAACDDGDTCTADDKCKAGACLPGPVTDCNDGNACTADSCDKTTGKCANKAAAGSCDDGNPCTTGESCKGGTCVSSGAKDCSDNEPCTDDACNKETGKCTNTPNTAVCDDGDGCTVKDTCSGGKCKAGPPNTCDDKDTCTADSCDKSTGKCVNKAGADGGKCDDGNTCTTGESCKAGKCTGKSVVCDDKNPCTVDSCDKLMGCQFGASTAACDDGNKCTDGDTCAKAKCVPGKPKICNDNNACTDDKCDKLKGCQHPPVTKPCNDNSACTSKDACVGGKCVGQAKSCDDKDQCTKDACNAKTGACSNTKIAGCVPKCSKDADCDDGNECTIDICNKGTGGCDDKNAPLGSVCGKDKVCDGAGTCGKSKPCTTWESAFGLHSETPKIANGTERNTAVVAASDGTVYAIGYTREVAKSYPYDGTVMAFTADGKFAWHTRWGDAGKLDYLYAGAGRDDGIWAVGHSRSQGSAGDYDGVALHVDKSGKVKSATFIASSYNAGKHREELRGAVATSGNGLIVCGRGYNGSTSYDPLIGRVDKDGKKLSATLIKSSGSDVVNGCALDKATGNVLLAGSNGTYAGGVWIVAKDDTLKTWVPVSAKYRALYGAVVTTKGKYAGVGTDTAPGAGDQAVVAFFDPDGKNLNKHLFGGASTDIFYAATAAANGGVWAAGLTRSYGAHMPGNEGWIARVGADGALVGQPQAMGGTGSDHLLGVDKHPAGGLVVAGETFNSATSYDRWVLRLSEFGALNCPGATVKCKNGNQCADGKLCTADVCDTKTGTCTNPAIPGCCLFDGHCDDGKFCTTSTCDGITNKCKPPVKKAACCDADGECDDNNACTADKCDAKHACGYTKIAGCCHIDVQCEDSNKCTEDRCEKNTCRNVNTCCKADKDCKAADSCSVGKCDAGSGKCSSVPTGKCDDKNACTNDWCDPKTGKCTNAPAPKGIPCGKDVACDGAGKCSQSTCTTFWDTFGVHQEKGSENYYTSTEYGGDVSATPDGGGWFVDYARTKATSYYTGRVVRRDATGKVLSSSRTTRVSKTSRHYAFGVATMPDGGALVVGRSNDTGTKGGNDLWLWRFDKAGKQVGHANHGGTSSDEAHHVIATSKGAVAVGSIYNSNNRTDGLVVWTDAAGKIVKTAEFGQVGGFYDYGYGVAHDPKTGVVVAAGTSSTQTKSNEGLLALFDSAGKRIAQRWVGGPGTSSDRLSAIARLPDGSYAAVGWAPHNGETAGWLVHVDAKLGVLSQRFFGRPLFTEYARRIAVLNGSVMIVGGGSRAWLHRFGLDLKPIGQLRVMDPTGGSLSGVAQAAGAGILLAGRTRLFNPGKSDYNGWHLKLTQDGKAACPGKPVKCTGDPMCDDSKVCTTDTCDTKTGACSHPKQVGCCESDAACSDGHACTTDTCVYGKCQSAAVPEKTPCGGGKLCSASGGCGCNFMSFIEDSSALGNPLKTYVSDTMYGIGDDGAGGTYALGATYTGSNITAGQRYQDAYVVRRDKKGKALWRKWVGSKYRDYLSAGTTHKGLAWGVGHNYTSTSSTTLRAWVFALDATGKKVVDARHGDRYTAFYTLAPAGDGVVVGGRVRSGSYYGALTQLDGKGQLTGVKTVSLKDTNTYNYPRGVAYLASTKSLAAVGYHYKGSALRDEGWLIRVDSAGKPTLTHPKSQAGNDRFWAIASVGSGMVAAGETQAGDVSKGYDGWLAFIDAAGKLTAQTVVGGSSSDTFRRVTTGVVAGKTVVLAAGTTGSSTAGSNDGWIVATDTSGKVLVTKTIGGKQYDAFNSCAIVSGNLHAVGSYRSDGTKSNDWWHVAVDMLGSPLCL